jgi:hypothetical protein
MRPVKTFDRSDLWFGIVLAPIFALVALAAFIVLGDFVTRPSFWSSLPILGFVLVASMMRGPLRRLGRAPRSFSWFCIGFTAAALVAIGQGHEFSLASAAGLGLAFVIIDFLSERYGPKEKRRMPNQ